MKKSTKTRYLRRSLKDELKLPLPDLFKVDLKFASFRVLVISQRIVLVQKQWLDDHGVAISRDLVVELAA
jgi:hypothetical protein